MWISLRFWWGKMRAQVIFRHHKLSDIHTHITDLGSFVIISKAEKNGKMQL